MNSLERLADDACRSLGDGPNSARLAAQRTAFINRVSRSERAPSRIRWGWVAAAAALIAGVSVGIVHLYPANPPPMNCWTTPHQLTGEGTWLQAPLAEEIPLHFSDTSEVRLGGGARARLVELRAKQVRVAIETGAVHSQVHHQEGVVWKFSAGPYEVRVVGTRLRIEWKPESEHLSVGVVEGRVAVTGGQLGSRSVEVLEGEELIASPMGTTLAGVRSPAYATPTDLLAPAVSPSGGAPGEAVSPPAVDGGSPGPMGSAVGVERAPDWRSYAKSGKYKDAVAAAEKAGFSGVTESIPESELLLLADAARLSGSGARATEALLALRRRFPSSRGAAQAAFRLGRMAFDGGQFADAARWFGVFLSESPGDGLAADALGRRMVALSRSGDRGTARNEARRYLSTYPSGPYHAVAESLLDDHSP